MTDARVARMHEDPRVRACAAVVLAANLGTAALIFTFTPFVTQIGVQFWFLAGALHGLVASRPRGGS
jgi:type IV secretory pathway TrbD component